MKKYLLLLSFTLLFAACRQADGGSPKVKIVTNYGNIVVRLYDQTPLHRDNFLKLAEEKSYDGMLFHRVIDGFMVQAGDPASKQAQPGETLGNSSIGDDIDAEIVPGLFHKKGALAAAREGDLQNPERRSSGSQFYIVQGVVYTQEQLKTRVDDINMNRNREILRKWEMDSTKNITASMGDSLLAADRLVLTPQQVEAYTTVGGSPHLDGLYTVFGEVVEGLDVIDRIAAAKTDANDRPVKDVRIKRMVIKK